MTEKNGTIDESRLESFCTLFEKNWKQHIEEHTEDYVVIASFDAAAKKMQLAIRVGSFNNDSRSFRKTCRELGIKNTYKAIRAYLEGK